jgi:hypothetical protein
MALKSLTLGAKAVFVDRNTILMAKYLYPLNVLPSGVVYPIELFRIRYISSFDVVELNADSTVKNVLLVIEAIRL